MHRDSRVISRNYSPFGHGCALLLLFPFGAARPERVRIFLLLAISVKIVGPEAFYFYFLKVIYQLAFDFRTHFNE